MNLQQCFRGVVVALSACFVSGPLLQLAADAASKPNILFIVADDLGWADVGWHGLRHLTPVMDRLVREGVELDSHYVQPVCTPTRTALLSGRWTSRFGPHVLGPSNLRAFPRGTVTLPGVLKSGGYTTHLAGKWHLGSREEWGPNHYGFDHSYGSLVGAVGPWTHQYRRGAYAKTWHRNGKRLDETGNATELVAGEVVKWIREKRSPWFIFVPFHAIHIPIDAPEEFKKRYGGERFHDDPKKDDAALRVAAFVTQLDAKIGEFIAALEATGQRENTLVVFHSDNGGLLKGGNPYISEVAGTPVLSSNLPLRGQKGQLYEGGIRVCAFANWPGRLQPRKVTAPLHVVDWMPTLTRLAGATVPVGVEQDGQEIWPLLSGAVKKPAARTIYIPARRGAVVRHGAWKLIASRDGKKRELFNLALDPYEKSNLATAEPAKLKEMERRLVELRQVDVKQLPEDLKGLAP